MITPLNRRFATVALASLALFATTAGSANAIISGVPPFKIAERETAGPLSVELTLDVEPGRDSCTSVVSCDMVLNACISAGLDFDVTQVNEIGQVIGGGCVQRWD